MMPLEITQGALRVLETDPNGWILTLVSISVVFGCLLILCGIYSLSGALFSGKISFKKNVKEDKGETAAAIAMAIRLETSGAVHDMESGFITIRHDNSSSTWNDKKLMFRKTPVKCQNTNSK